MKVRVLSHKPHKPKIEAGKVYDLEEAHAKGMIEAGEAEEVDAKVSAEPDPYKDKD